MAPSNLLAAVSVDKEMGHRPSTFGSKCLETSRVRARTVATFEAIWMIMLAAIAFSSPAGADPNPGPNLSDFACAVPALPHGVAKGSSNTMLSGPAVTALTGGAARHGFSLDDRDLVVKPPRRGDVPRLSANQAICAATASTAGLSGSVEQGIAVGYGRVSVASRFFPVIGGFSSSGDGAADYQTVASFHDRLAWLVVVHSYYGDGFSCPAEHAPVRLVARRSDHGYEVFMIDANTGTDALVYREGGLGGCTAGARVPPSLSVAEESVSVPWTLVSRDPDGYAGTIAATVLPCDQTPSTVLVDRSGPNVEVRVTRPYGPSCGLPETVLIGLRAAVVTADLPAVIGHDPVGLTNLLSLRASPTVGSTTITTTTTPALVQVDASTNGQTVDVEVGQVIAVNPLSGAQGLSFTSPAISNDPAVLGPLTSSPQPLVAEFRAWKVGSAQITVPQSACIQPDSNQLPCTGTFVVYVVVH